MADLWIREYGEIGSAFAGAYAGAGAQVSPAPVPKEPGIADQKVTYTTSTQSAVFNNNTRLVSVVSTSAFHYAVGTNPTATTDSLLVPANVEKTFCVQPGQRLAAIAAA